jgi:hypothetical protein
MSTIDKAEAARILGMKESEVYRVIDTDHGPVAVTKDGTECLILEDRICAINRDVRDVWRFQPDEDPAPAAAKAPALEIDEASVVQRAAASEAKRTEDEKADADAAKATPEAEAVKAAKKAPARGRS